MEKKKTNNEQEEKVEEKSIEEILKEKDEEIANWKNRYYMAYADMDNLKKLYEKEHLDILKYRAAGFVENLMPVLDNFHVALNLPTDDPKIKNFLIGFEFIYKQMVSALEAEGIAKLEPIVGKPFDASYMHALEAEESDMEPNMVVKVMTCGYKLKDRVIRPAMVIVSKKKEAKEKDENETTNQVEEGE